MGRLPGPRSEALLAARVSDSERRPERLLAVELLAGRPSAGRAGLTRVAQWDPDPVVAARARWALEQAIR